jgi:hypothetical protein
MASFRFTDETKTITHRGRSITLHRIISTEDFVIGNPVCCESHRCFVKAGELGGWIEKRSNLSPKGRCWVDQEAMVFGRAKVFGNAIVYGHAKIFGNAKVYDDAQVYGYAQISGCTKFHSINYVCGHINLSKGSFGL